MSYPKSGQQAIDEYFTEKELNMLTGLWVKVGPEAPDFITAADRRTYKPMSESEA
eukprot:CAMPEP_0185596080 /NCGR_PEP_ID=MMETSP0434-20130131/80505_1 /TAXON_ID=626734 ORGANISM="Favella taraikaensis, Strain Fe Narragansett Bay" /NCGR_SAMPLE_ID=MMETSP0434 /ASSEMBLY_ACC=CAM_ASM_000379 /LENGTH=54 /DNA_ID=CAMNT_0028224513 /DNA_START=190 /DNA_END=350 /DNA_ORIENTATION=-